jgi:DNA mismatch endonuclease, patch repair protein
VFTAKRVAVFVDGCFWHGCPVHGTTPATNREFWMAKIAANRERDARTTASLEADGWTVLRFWEHDDPSEAVHRVLEAVS